MPNPKRLLDALYGGAKAAKAAPKPAVSRLDMSFKDVTKRMPELQQAANLYEQGKITREQYYAIIDQLKPVTPYDFVPKPATAEEALAALTSNKVKDFGRTDLLTPGETVMSRLDIPAYSQKGTWVTSQHRLKPPADEPKTIYTPTMMLEGETKMLPGTKAARKVAKGEANKESFATIRGAYKPGSDEEAVERAIEALRSKDYAQIGYDPERRGFFYDRKTMEPIVGTEEGIIQIGPLVLGKKPIRGKPEDFEYAGGGAVGLQSGGTPLDQAKDDLTILPEEDAWNLLKGLDRIYTPKIGEYIADVQSPAELLGRIKGLDPEYVDALTSGLSELISQTQPVGPNSFDSVPKYHGSDPLDKLNRQEIDEAAWQVYENPALASTFVNVLQNPLAYTMTESAVDQPRDIKAEIWNEGFGEWKEKLLGAPSDIQPLTKQPEDEELGSSYQGLTPLLQAKLYDKGQQEYRSGGAVHMQDGGKPPPGIKRAIERAGQSKSVLPVAGARQARQAIQGYLGMDPSFSVMDPEAQSLESAYRGGESASVLGDLAASLTPFATASALSKVNQTPGLAQLIAYHGSPHKFKKFDASKIGTGEGAQAYGHGLYFAESPDVAKTYQPRSPQYEQKLLKKYNAAEAKRDYTTMEILEDAMMHRSPEEILQRFTNVSEGYTPAHAKAAKDFANWYAKNLPEVGGMYRVDIPDEKIAQMLDWDKPLSQQPVAMQVAKKVFNDPQRKAAGFPSITDEEIASLTGQDLYQAMTTTRGGLQPGASKSLLQEGIPGIQYLDQASRNAKQGTRNFVIFPGEEQNIKMLDINGEPQMAKGGKVCISDNLDTMRLELMRAPRMQEGGAMDQFLGRTAPRGVSALPGYGQGKEDVQQALSAIEESPVGRIASGVGELAEGYMSGAGSTDLQKIGQGLSMIPVLGLPATIGRVAKTAKIAEPVVETAVQIAAKPIQHNIRTAPKSIAEMTAEMAEKGKLNVREPSSLPGQMPSIPTPNNIQPITTVQLPSGQFATTTGFSTVKPIRTGFDVAETPEQVAHLTAGLRKSPQEQVVAVVVDENNKPIQIIRHTIGLINEASTEPFSLVGSIANTPGAKGFYISHNHPSGISELSTADQRLADVLNNLTKDTGLEMKGILAVGKNKFGYYDPVSKATTKDQAIPAAVRNKSIDMVERTLKKTQLLDQTQLDSPQAAVRFADKFAGDQTGILLLNNQQYPVGFLPIDPSQFANLRKSGTSNSILRALEKANSNKGVLITKENIKPNELENVEKFFNASHVRMLDAILGPKRESAHLSSSFGRTGLTDFLSVAPVAVGLGAAAMQEDEYKKGGRVHISDNPDTMRLELLRKKHA